MEPEQVLCSALKKERDAEQLYRRVAAESDDPGVRALLAGLADDEAEHADALEGLRPEQISEFEPEERPDLKIAAYLAEKTLGADSDLKDTLAFAIRREQEARDFYRGMSLGIGDPRVSELFRKLSVMENNHKARLEELYRSTFAGGA